MAFATLQDIKDHAIFRAEISTLADPIIQRLLDRAARMIVHKVGSTFAGETNPDVLFDLNVATVYMVDKLFIITQPSNAENAVMGVQSEKVLERSYTLSPAKIYAAEQFEEEFLLLISKLKARKLTRRPIFEIGRGPSFRGLDESCESELD